MPFVQIPNPEKSIGLIDVEMPIIWDTIVPGGNVITDDATPVVITDFDDGGFDGVISMITNVVASVPDGTAWAIWLFAQAVFVRSNGVLSLIAPIGPQGPSGNAGGNSGTWRVEFSAVNNRILITLTGANGTSIKWSSNTAGNRNTSIR